MEKQAASQPVIITCKFNDEVAGYFNNYRQQYFPADKNFLKAHLTLFHHLLLPFEEVSRRLQQVLSTQKLITATVERIAFTGKGVAFVITSKELIQLHKKLQRVFADVLTTQDSHGLWPHVTIQNKAPVDVSKSLTGVLQKSFQPFNVDIIGLQVFYYLNGPWQHIQDALF